MYSWTFIPYRYNKERVFCCIADTLEEARNKAFAFIEEMNRIQDMIDQIWRQIRENVTRVHLCENQTEDNTKELVLQKEKLILELPAMISMGNLPDLSSFTKSNLAEIILTSPSAKLFYPISLN
jgi:hypothetical protein